MPVRSWLRRGIPLLVAISALATALTAMTVASADDNPTADLGGNVPITAKEFGTNDCALLPPSIKEDQDGWVFVLPNNKWRFASVTATFTDAKGATQTGNATPAKPPHGTATSKYYVITPAGWMLSGASAEVEPKVERPGAAPTSFDLMHTCPGTPEEPEPEPSTSTPSPSTSTSSSQDPSSESPSSGTTTGSERPDDSGLPITGRSLTVPLLLGLGLVAAGLVVVILARRRRLGSSVDDITD